MAKELVLDVVARKNSKDLVLLAEEFQRLADEADKSGKSLQKNASFSKFLQDQTVKTKAALADLRAEFDRTGALDVASQISGLEKNLKSLESLSKRFKFSPQVDPSFFSKLRTTFKSEAEVFKNEFEGGILKSIFTTPTGLTAAVGGAVLLGNAVGGAVLTGIGLAGIGAGIAIALHDPAIQPALQRLKGDIGDGLKDAAKPFVPQLQAGLDILDRGFAKSLPGIQDTFAQLAPEVTTLAHGFSGFLGPVVTGLEHAAVAAKPLVDEFANNFLPQLGSNLGSLFDTMAAHSKEAEGGLRALEDTINTTVVATRDLIPVFAKLGDVLKYGTAGGLEDFAIKLFAGQKALDAYHTNAPKTIQISGDVVAAFQKATSAATQEAIALDRLNGGLSTLIGNELSVAQAGDAFQHGLNDLSQALDQNNHTLVGNSDAAIQNREAILALIGQAEQAREAQIQMAGGTNASKAAIDAANASYEVAIGKIEAVGTKAGLSKAQLDQLAGQYNIDVILAVQEINASPLAQLVAPHDPNRYGSSGPPKRAGGGPVSAGSPYIVGEQGPELFLPSISGVIAPTDALRRLAAPSVRSWTAPAARSGGGALVVSGAADSALAALLQEMVRTGQLQLVAA